MNATRQHRTETARRGFTLIELLVVIAIIALLVSILLPSLSRAKQLAKGVVCQTQIRNGGIAGQFYQEDHNGLWRIYGNDQYYSPWSNRVGWALFAEVAGYLDGPAYDNWDHDLADGGIPASNEAGLMCPDTQIQSDWTSYMALRYRTYGANFRGHYRGVGLVHDENEKGFQRFYQNPKDDFSCRWSICISPQDLEDPQQTFALADTSAWGAKPFHDIFMAVGGVRNFWAPHYDNRANVLYADGHVEPASDEQIEELYYPGCGISLN